jgi:D-glycero-D-manno-heptose 1,7-bisphosphate phosphatase
MNRCIFLDRDGVLNADELYYTYRPEDVVVLPGVAEALRLLQEQGYLLIVVTNQAGIAKELYSGADVWAVHRTIEQATGIRFDDLYYSPHHPDHSTRSLRRKPDSLMLERAMAKHGIDPSASWMIGDRESDIQAGQKAGLRTIRLHTGEAISTQADFCMPALYAAAKHIVSNEKSPPSHGEAED